MLDKKNYSFWFVTGSQHLYGPETLEMVDAHSKTIAEGLDKSPSVPFKVVFKPVLTTPDAIRRLCLDANSDDSCAGIITWMHTFSPAKMWIAGLSELRKPMLHLHTQFNRDIPWSEIDMDFMNLNQSAHGDRIRSSAPACVLPARSSSAIGKTRKHATGSAAGCVRQLRMRSEAA